MRTTQRKGDICVTRAIASFTELGFDVSLPVTESAPYDLIVDDAGTLSRVQCKYSSSQAVDLRRIHSNSRGYVVKLYGVNAYDWLYVYHPDTGDYLVKECSGKSYYWLKREHLILAGKAGASAPTRLESVVPA